MWKNVRGPNPTLQALRSKIKKSQTLVRDSSLITYIDYNKTKFQA